MTGATAAIVACLSAAGAGPIVVPPIARPPLPLPMPNPTRDARRLGNRPAVGHAAVDDGGARVAARPAQPEDRIASGAADV